MGIRVDQFNNPNLEADILGTMLNAHNIDEAISILDTDCFYGSKNKIIYSVIYKLWKDNKPVDLTTVFAELGKDVSKIGVSYLSAINEAGTSSRILIPKCKKLIEYKQRLKAYKLLEQGINMFEKEEETNKITGFISNGLDFLVNDDEDDNGDIINSLNITINNINKQVENEGKIFGIKTGLEQIDDRINGLNKGEFILISGRPGMGKSTLANNIAIKVAKTNKVALFNLEMSKEQIFRKVLSCISLIESEKIKKGLLNQQELNKLLVAQKGISELHSNLKIYENVLSLDKIISKCRIMSKQKNLDVLIIDYLQLIATTNKFQSREQEISHISRTLKLLSKELGITVIALSQLSRACEQRADHRPMLSDLRESGSLEQDCDISLMCYRDNFYNPESEEKGIIEVICNKNRNGEVGTMKFAWLPQYQKIGNLDIFDYAKEVKEKSPF